MGSHLSVNNNSLKLVRKILENPEYYNVILENIDGARIIDCGIKAKGGYEAGRLLTEICLGGYGRTGISVKKYGDLMLPSVNVYTDSPSIAALGSQLAGWRIKIGDYQAIGSGPARALSLKPKEIYDKIGYKDNSSSAVIVLETSTDLPLIISHFVSFKISLAICSSPSL